MEENPAAETAESELEVERRKREELEARLNELVEENRKAKAMAEETERHSAIKAELERLGVGKVDLAFRAVRGDIGRSGDGRVVARTAAGEIALAEYLRAFVEENPELMPARISGGSGASPTASGGEGTTAVDLDSIRPGMSAENMERVRQEIARVAARTLRGW
jgi:hypothetical protein